MARRNTVQKQDTIVSIDVGSAFTKIIKVKPQEYSLVVTDCALISTGSNEAETQGRIKQALSGIVSFSESVSVFTTLSGEKVSLRRLSIPSVPQKELQPFLESTICKEVGYSLDEIIFHYFILGDVLDRGIKKLDVLFAVIRKPDMVGYLRFFNAMEIVPTVISSPAWTFSHVLKDIQAVSVMVVHIGYRRTEITVFNEGTILFSRTVSFGL